MKNNFFVRRPIFAMVIAIVTLILGAISIADLPVEQYPDITPPMVQVQATYQGADALSVEESVATPIEEAVNGVSDMIYMMSTNSSNGQMSLDVSFAVGSNPDLNTIFTQNRVSTATPELPPIVATQGVTTTKTQTSFILVMSLFSDGRFDETFIANYAMINLQDRLKRINGVGQVQILGAGEYAMRIWIRPDRLDYLNITVEQIVAAINSQSQIVPGGQLGGEPAPDGTEYTYTILMPAQDRTPEEFANIIIRTNPDGSLLRLGDVDRIELGAQTYNISSRYNNLPSAVIPIYLAPGNNAVEVGRKIKQVMAELSKNFPEGMDYDIIVDSTETIMKGIEEIILTLLFALILVIAVIYFFVQDFRATLVPVIAIPVSLVGAFILFPLFGFSINVFSMLALVLAIGLVVDDAIVVVEAVQVNIARGMSPRVATVAAMNTVASPIIATTVVLIAVFLPVGLMPGAAGKLYQQFALTIAFSVALSGINALTLSPALCSILMRPSSSKKDSALNRFFGRFNHWFDSSVDKYLDKNKIIMRHSARTFIFIAIIAAAALAILRFMPSGFLPDEDQGYLLTNIQLPAAASLQRTEQTINDIITRIKDNPNIESISGVAGYSILSGSASSNMGVLFISLKDYSKRKATASQLVEQLNSQLYEQINSANVYTFGPPSIPGLGPGSGFTIMIQDKGGNSPQYLAENCARFVEAASRRPEVQTITETFSANVPQRAISINDEMVLKAGVDINEVHNVLSTFLGGSYVNTFNRFGRLYQIYIQAEADYRQREEQLDLYFITNNQGETFPLSAFIEIRDTIGVQYTNRFNLYRASQVTGLPAKGYSTSECNNALAEVADSVLPDDMGYAWSNMSYQEENTHGEGIVFLYAVIFVFLILAALYESWTLPLAVIVGIPFAIFGAMLFLAAGYLINPKYINDIFLQVSLIMLIGLAAKNAILIIEYAKERFDEGMSLKDAALESAKLRIRPIIMTSLSFILGVLPLIFATGANSTARNEMGLALFGGMLITTIIALFTYPAIFVAFGKWCKYEKIREKELLLAQEDAQAMESINTSKNEKNSHDTDI